MVFLKKALEAGALHSRRETIGIFSIFREIGHHRQEKG